MEKQMKHHICRRDFLKSLGTTAVCLALTGSKKIGKAENITADKSLNVPSYLKGYKQLYAQSPHSAALEWFKNAKFGLFIHYGLYSILGHECWALKNEKIPLAEYEKLKDKFTAEKFDADFITDLAVAAGMKYVNITSKHHDGFCLFRSAYSDYNSVNSPAKRDLVAELAEQCQKKKLGLFLYYSYALDWRHPYFYPSQYCDVSRFDLDNPEPGYKFRHDEDFRRYIDFAHNQLGELLSNYGPLAGIWFDPMTAYYARPDLFPIEETYAMIRKLQPQTLISFKQGATGTEDFASPERSGRLNYDWVEKRFPNNPLSLQVAKNACKKNAGKHNEICDTLQRRKWGYYPPEDNNHLNTEEVLQRLGSAGAIDCNLLLNTGPLPDGSIHKTDIQTLRAVGKAEPKLQINNNSYNKDTVLDKGIAQ
jgi:alpha-L-fucosidase